MAKRFLLRALVALLVYCSVVGTFFWSPRVSGKVTPYLHAVLTESIDFDKVRRVVSDLFSHSMQLNRMSRIRSFTTVEISMNSEDPKCPWSGYPHQSVFLANAPDVRLSRLTV